MSNSKQSNILLKDFLTVFHFRFITWGNKPGFKQRVSAALKHSVFRDWDYQNSKVVSFFVESRHTFSENYKQLKVPLKFLRFRVTK